MAISEHNQVYRIIGVDPGSAITGYGIVEVRGRHPVLVDYGVLRTPSGQEITKRYRAVHEGILALLRLHKPIALAVESQYVGMNVQSTLKLSMARAVVMLAATLEEIEVFEYAPSRAKRAVVGNGSASKEQVKHMVTRLLNLQKEVTSEDAADALALAICHVHLLQSNQHKEFKI